MKREDLGFNKISEYVSMSFDEMTSGRLRILQDKYARLFNAYNDLAIKFAELWNLSDSDNEILKAYEDSDMKLYDLLERINFPMVSKHTGEVLNINDLDLATFRKLTDWWLGLK
jgi:hypothetical protein